MTVRVMPPPDEGELCLVLDPERHRVLDDNEWTLWVRRELSAPDLFLYWHRKELCFVLASWVERGKSCRELRVFKEPPWRVPDRSATLESLRRRLRPPEEHEGDMKKAIREQASEKVRALEAKAEARKNASRELRRQGLEEAALQAEAGAGSFEAPSVEGEELRKHLEDAARGRIVG